MRHIVVLTFLFLLLFAIGCSGQYSDGDPGKRDDDFLSGSGSLEFSFSRNAPPNEVYQQQQSTVALKVQNVGASDIRSGYVTLSYDKGILDFTERRSETFSIRGKSVDYPQGDTKILTFPFYALPLATESQVRETSIVASACYDYQTKVIEQVCIDTDPYDLKPDSENGVCDTRDINPGATGGPVRVNKIETQFLSIDGSIVPQFVITFGQSNVASDKIYAPGNGNSFCSSGSFNPENNNVVEYFITLSDQEISCSREKLQLIEGSTTMTCKGFAIDESLGSYEAPLHIELYYGVAKTQSTKIKILR